MVFDPKKRVFHLTKHIPVSRPDYLTELDDEQIEPVLAIKGPVLVKAGAGSGKTRVLTYRVAHMIRSGIRPEEILLLTFTNKSAKEMMERVRGILGETPAGLVGGTYHHVGNTLLRRYAKLVGLKSNYTILDNEDVTTLIKMAVAECSIDIKETRLPKARVLKEIFSLSVNKNVPIQEVVHEGFPSFLPIVQTLTLIRDTYQRIKLEQNVVDFDDILVYVYQLLKDNPSIASYYANQKFRYKLIDEFQDTNFIQYEIIKLLSGEEKNVMVVGDANQSIYRWRGADVDNILSFEEIFPKCQTFSISYNYRSTPEILSFANDSIFHNLKRSDIRLQSQSTPGCKPYLMKCSYATDEASFVADRILSLREEGVELKEIGVLYRSHYLARELELELTMRNIPYNIFSGIEFFSQKHIKDVLSFIKLIENPKDFVSWNRLLQYLDGIGAQSAKSIMQVLNQQEDVFSYLRENPSYPFVKRGKDAFSRFAEVLIKTPDTEIPSELLSYYLSAFYKEFATYHFDNAKERVQDIQSLIEFSFKYNDLSVFLEEVTLITELNGQHIGGTQENHQEKTSLMTIHKSKGLEWKYVFLIGAREGVFPSDLSMNDPDKMEEERRLFYVAATRAKKELYVSYPTRFFSFKTKGYVFSQPSSFIQELNPELFDVFDVQ